MVIFNTILQKPFLPNMPYVYEIYTGLAIHTILIFRHSKYSNFSFVRSFIILCLERPVFLSVILKNVSANFLLKCLWFYVFQIKLIYKNL